jgi:mannose-1-phosphate guanylyltransferase
MLKVGIIMAGGGGTRFWPLSRRQMPKQFLNLSGNDAMINETIDRLSNVVKQDNIYVVTAKSQATQMAKTTGDKLNINNIICEPSARNTAACIGYSAVKIVKEYGDAIMVITPSDAYIKNIEAYTSALNTAAKVAEKEDVLVTIGIKPTFPATGYGYIKYNEGTASVKEVTAFAEKPNRETAEYYLKNGGYAWNSGMFIWKASCILNAFKNYLPDTYVKLMQIKEAIATENEAKVVESIYPTIQSISIDYGIMERANNIKVVPADLGWSDVGSWDMLDTIKQKDKDGNVTSGDILSIESKNSVIISNKKPVVALGVENLVIVETDDVVMVCPKDKAQDVKRIVDTLKKQGREELL